MENGDSILEHLKLTAGILRQSLLCCHDEVFALHLQFLFSHLKLLRTGRRCPSRALNFLREVNFKPSSINLKINSNWALKSWDVSLSSSKYINNFHKFCKYNKERCKSGPYGNDPENPIRNCRSPAESTPPTVAKERMRVMICSTSVDVNFKSLRNSSAVAKVEETNSDCTRAWGRAILCF